MVVPISIGACWNPINPIHSGWGILIQCLFFESTVVFFNTNTVSVEGQICSISHPHQCFAGKTHPLNHQLENPPTKIWVSHPENLIFSMDLGISPSPPSYSPAIQEEKPPLFDANGIPGAPWHSESGARPMGRTRSPNRWVETNPWIFFLGAINV